MFTCITYVLPITIHLHALLTRNRKVIWCQNFASVMLFYVLVETRHPPHPPLNEFPNFRQTSVPAAYLARSSAPAVVHRFLAPFWHTVGKPRQSSVI